MTLAVLLGSGAAARAADRTQARPAAAAAADKPAKPDDQSHETSRRAGARTDENDAGERKLSLYAINTGERLQVVYWADGRYRPDALKALNRLLRDRRNQAQGDIDPRLLDLLHRLATALDTTQPIHVISAYRSPETNAARAATPGSGVASNSLHVQGQAIDIRIPGVPLTRLRDAAVALGVGGVGFYPDSDFVHVDVGRPRRW